MLDVVIIGGGNAGSNLARQCSRAGYDTIIVELCCARPEDWAGEWVKGRGTVAGPGLVAVLDPDTADERRLLQTRAIVLAVGRLDLTTPEKLMLGVTKLGAVLNDNKTAVLTDDHGRTGASGIFATGSCASASTPYLMEALEQFLTTAAAGKAEEAHG